MTGVPSWLAALGGIDTVQVNGSPISGAYETINIVGSGISGAADTANQRYTVTIPTSGGGSGGAVVVDKVSPNNRTLSGTAGAEGLQVGDRVLVAGQTNEVQNGLYTVAAGAWSRDPLFDAAGDLTPGMLFVDLIPPGDTPGEWWYLANDTAPDPGTDQIYFERLVPDASVPTYLSLTDTPSAFTSAADQLVAINAGESATEFRANTKLAATDTLWFTPETSVSGSPVAGAILITSGTTQLDPSVPLDLSGSVIIGASVATSITGNGSSNTIVGAGAASSLTAGTANLYFGSAAGFQHDDGSGCVFIGPLTGSPSGTLNNFINVANTIYGDSSQGIVRIGDADVASQSAGLSVFVGSASDPAIEFGTTGNYVGAYTRASSPNASLSADGGSLCVETTSGAQKLWINTSVGSGTTWTALGLSALPPGYADIGKQIVTGGTTQWSVTGAGRVRDSANVVDISWASTLSNNASTVGANGRDAGSLAADTLYRRYVIWGSGQPVATLTSTSATPTLPSGYTRYRYIGSHKTAKVGTNFLECAIYGVSRVMRTVYGGANTEREVVVGAAQYTLNPQAAANFYPAGASVLFSARHSNTAGGYFTLGRQAETVDYLRFASGTSEQSFSVAMDQASTSFKWRFTVSGGTASATIEILGFEEFI